MKSKLKLLGTVTVLPAILYLFLNFASYVIRPVLQIFLSRFGYELVVRANAANMTNVYYINCILVIIASIFILDMCLTKRRTHSLITTTLVFMAVKCAVDILFLTLGYLDYILRLFGADLFFIGGYNFEYYYSHTVFRLFSMCGIDSELAIIARTFTYVFDLGAAICVFFIIAFVAFSWMATIKKGKNGKQLRTLFAILTLILTVAYYIFKLVTALFFMIIVLLAGYSVNMPVVTCSLILILVETLTVSAFLLFLLSQYLLINAAVKEDKYAEAQTGGYIVFEDTTKIEIADSVMTIEAAPAEDDEAPVQLAEESAPDADEAEAQPEA